MSLSKREIAMTIRNLHIHVDFLKEVSCRLSKFTDRQGEEHVLRNAAHCASAATALFEYIGDLEYERICKDFEQLEKNRGVIDTF